MSVSKSDVIDQVSKETGIAKATVSNIIGKAFDHISGALADVGEVKIHGFGNFLVKTTKEREGRNPATGEPVTIAAGKKVSFKPSSDLKKVI